MLSNCRNMASDNCMAINLIGEGDSSSRCCPIHITATGCWCLQRKKKSKKLSTKNVYKECVQMYVVQFTSLLLVGTGYCYAITHHLYQK